MCRTESARDNGHIVFSPPAVQKNYSVGVSVDLNFAIKIASGRLVSFPECGSESVGEGLQLQVNTQQALTADKVIHQVSN